MLIKRKADKSGFNAAFIFDGFKCAFITHSESYAFGCVKEMKRHNKTDEIFILLSGRAVLLTLEDGEFSEYELEANTAYNVSAGTWHYLAVSEDAKLFVTERHDTNATNTDVMKLEFPYNLFKNKIK